MLTESDCLYEDYPIFNDVLINLEKLEKLKVGTKFSGEFRVESLYQDLPSNLKQIVLLDGMCCVNERPKDIQIIRMCEYCCTNFCSCSLYDDSLDNVIDLTKCKKEREYFRDLSEIKYSEIEFDMDPIDEINRYSS